MLLRDHPLMSCYGIPSWPPTWMLLNGPGPSRLTGEIGILRAHGPMIFHRPADALFIWSMKNHLTSSAFCSMISSSVGI
jgi:hypothetical protein